MVVPISGNQGMDGYYVLFVSTVTVVIPCQGFKAQHGLISSCFTDTLLLIVVHGQMCKLAWEKNTS